MAYLSLECSTVWRKWDQSSVACISCNKLIVGCNVKEGNMMFLVGNKLLLPNEISKWNYR